MPDLFAQSEAVNLEQVQPLAARMRPRSLAEFAGQQHFLGEGKLLWRMLRAKRWDR
jgi:putative ATPase